MTKAKSRIYLLTLLLAFFQATLAQERHQLHIMGQANYACSNGENAPFWLSARRQGLTSNNLSNGYMRLAGALSGNIGKSNFSYKIMADGSVGHNSTSTLFLQQAYAEAGWRWLRLSIGSKERFGESSEYSTAPLNCGLSNKARIAFPDFFRQMTDLGSGGLVYSGNSRPIPQIRVEVPEYTLIAGTNNWLHMRGHIAYGRFTDGNFQEKFSEGNAGTRYGKNILYHSKAAFMKVSNLDKFPLEIEGGLEMYSQFGGDIYTHSKGKILSMPRRLSDYFKAFIPLSGGEDTPLDEQTNISGNQIGNWHAALTLHTKPMDFCLYGEHIFEDFSQLFFFEYQSNKEGKRKIIYYPWRDIKLGIRITNKSSLLRFVGAIQYEYLNTYDQSGALYHDPSKNFNEQMDGVDNYYNHGIYPGWHHWGMNIGSPLIMSPIYNKDGSLAFKSNRVVAHNVGICGTFCKKLPVTYRLQYTYSENWGTYLNPLRKKYYTTSLLGEFTFTPNNSHWAGSLSIAYDKSNHIGNNFGAMITITRTCSIIFGKKK